MNELCHLWRSERYEACGDDGRKGPFRAKRPRFPGPLSEYVRRRCSSSATELESSCLPVRLSGFLPASPVQSYPPKLASSFNPITFLNAARGLCGLFQSLPERV